MHVGILRGQSDQHNDHQPKTVELSPRDVRETLYVSSPTKNKSLLIADTLQDTPLRQQLDVITFSPGSLVLARVLGDATIRLRNLSPEMVHTSPVSPSTGLCEFGKRGPGSLCAGFKSLSLVMSRSLFMKQTAYTSR